jgi:hypothetical protein
MTEALMQAKSSLSSAPHVIFRTRPSNTPPTDPYQIANVLCVICVFREEEYSCWPHYRHDFLDAVLQASPLDSLSARFSVHCGSHCARRSTFVGCTSGLGRRVHSSHTLSLRSVYSWMKRDQHQILLQDSCVPRAQDPVRHNQASKMWRQGTLCFSADFTVVGLCQHLEGQPQYVGYDTVCSLAD